MYIVHCTSVLNQNTLDPDPGFWPNLDSDPDPGPDPDPGLYNQFLKKKIKNNFTEKQILFFKNTVYF